MSGQTLDRRGLWIAIASFLLWGVMPLWWHLMKSVPSLQIVLHRIAWSAVIVGAFLFWRDGRGWLKRALSKPNTWWMLALSGVLIGFNWGLYIWAVNAGHVVESSLGYFINPLLNVLLGVVFLRERLGRVQWVSVAIATFGVAWLTFRFGQLPWIALALAASFALYGLIRKLAAVDSIDGLGVEGAYLFLPVVAMLAWSETHGQGGFFDGYGIAMSVMLIVSGALTALPLVGFAYAVRRVPLVDHRLAAVRRADDAIPDRRVRLPRSLRPRSRSRIRLHLDRPGDLRDRRRAACAPCECARDARSRCLPPLRFDHAPDAPQLRMLRQGPAARCARRADLFLRMHVLRGLRDWRAEGPLPELRRDICAAADARGASVGRRTPRRPSVC